VIEIARALDGELDGIAVRAGQGRWREDGRFQPGDIAKLLRQWPVQVESRLLALVPGDQGRAAEHRAG
jgi:hypothetical protein